jgi:hypothetical protein
MGGAEYSPFIVRPGSVEGNIAIWKLFGKLVDIEGRPWTQEEKTAAISIRVGL